ncbi:toll/interleukin-1 receptor domain-containing protein [Brevibacillus porteri]|uniref:toll/interleukin-1 receptor domain-containing protein n=1 Tax=Brevibacillus porteri TaxID=2126350 RepID=UPI003D24B328
MINFSISSSYEGIKTKISEGYGVEGICINFVLKKINISEREKMELVTEYASEFDWIEVENKKFFFDLNKLRESNEYFSQFSWLDSKIHIAPEFDSDLDSSCNIIAFPISKQLIESSKPKRIFLSHKSTDKKMVQRYYDLLEELGFSPWLDKHALTSGMSRDRAILNGLKESCAVVFFITPNFKDEKYLEDEIDWARDEVKEKGEDKFRIISLLLKNESGEVGTLPPLLKKYIYQEPETEIEAFNEIIRALPIKVGNVIWN